MEKADLIVIGSGPAGQRAAIQAAKLGKRVILIERRGVLGGVTVHTGTIPSKTLREAALYLTGWTQRGVYGRNYRVKQDLSMADLMQRLEITIRREVEVIQNQLTRNGVTVVQGNAHFIDPHRITIDCGEGCLLAYSADLVLIATGTVPYRPPDFPFNETNIIDSDGVLHLSRLPRSMTIIGAGVIGLEYASIFSILDIEVTLVDSRTTLLDFLDKEILEEFTHGLRERGVVLRLGEKVARIETPENSHLTVHLESGKRFSSELILYTAGRVGATAQLCLANAGLSADERGRIKVDATYRTDVPHIYAAGDVIGFPSLASTSMEQGRVAACHAFGQATNPTSPDFPFGIYGIPEISMVGKTEQTLQADKIPYEVGVARFRETARGQILSLTEGILKLIVRLDDRKLLGVHILGENAAELVHIGQAVLNLGGTLDYFLDTVFNYPTLAEAYKVAALDAWNRLC